MDVRSLTDIRSRIDDVDREIIALMANRGAFVRQAATFKTSLTDVAAPSRVQQVIEKVRALADEFGLEPPVAEATYRAMIAAFIEVERSTFVQARADSPKPET